MSSLSARKQEIARRFSSAASTYASFADLQAAIADTLLHSCHPQGIVLDAGCGRGRESMLLSAHAAVEQVIALDMAPAMLAAIPAVARVQPLRGDIEALPLPDASVDVVFSNFAMQWCESREQASREIFRVLKPGGRLLASVPGPDSLAALRASGLLHINGFASAGDWATALMQAGFSACEFTQKDFSAHFVTVGELLHALQGIGANTSDAPRDNHLRGKQWLLQVTSALEQQREPAGLPLRYDVIFMQATRETGN
ncbi:MAG TPA: hypothetical protein DF427_13195 [Moraxellaceae bacterium]|nr:hypothetical protein [Moraxellaceae bacterium]